MNQVASGSVRWGISKLYNLLETQGKLNHDQRLRVKEDGRPCPPVSIKNCSSRLSKFCVDWWECGKYKYFCWLRIVIGGHSKMRICYLIFDGKLCDPC